MQKHKARLRRAQELREKKTRVPHATGKKWTGALTKPRAPRLSYQSRPRRSAQEPAPVAPVATYAGAAERRGLSRGTTKHTTKHHRHNSSSGHPSRAAAEQTKQTKQTYASSTPRQDARRGSFSSPYGVAVAHASPQADAQAAHDESENTSFFGGSQHRTMTQSVAPAVTSLEQLAAEPGDEVVAVEYQSTDHSLHAELERLRSELRAEEEKHKRLIVSKQDVAALSAPPAPPARPPASSFAAPPPPAPPPGLPTTPSSMKAVIGHSSAAQMKKLSRMASPAMMTARASHDTRVPMRNVPIVDAAEDHDEENSGHMTYMQLHQNQTRDSETALVLATTAKKNSPVPLCMKTGPNWESIQNSVQNMLSQDVTKRKNMEARLREMEDRNMKILGVDAKQFERITGKRIKSGTPAAGSTGEVRQTRSAKKSVSNHKQRMGRALSNKLSTTTRSVARGGALSRSRRVLM
jgi:hypothetical protein